MSQFGGIGGGAGGAAGLLGFSAPEDDPYSKIVFDMKKVEQSKVPTKPHELKSEEEKKKEIEQRKASGGKSNLKKTTDDDDKKKKGVTFGKSTKYEVTGNESESGDY